MQICYTTPGGYRRLHQRLERAKQEYKKVCESNEEAAQAGDNCVWHDNFAYEENQRMMHQLSRRVRDLETLMATVKVVPIHREPPEKVRLGVRVRIAMEGESEDKVLFIAGYEDGEPSEQRISYNTPMAQALIGKEEGDVSQMRVGTMTRSIEILEILPPPQEEFLANDTTENK